MITRRRFAQSASIAIVGSGLAGSLRGACAANGLSEELSASFTQIEKVAGRLGDTVLRRRSSSRPT